jgi:site-specific DNA recombinase
MFATGDIKAVQLARISERLRSERAQAAVEAAPPVAVPAKLIGGAAATAWAALSIDKRAVLRFLVEVTIMPSGSGKVFAPETVRIGWNG